MWVRELIRKREKGAFNNLIKKDETSRLGVLFQVRFNSSSKYLIYL